MIQSEPEQNIIRYLDVARSIATASILQLLCMDHEAFQAVFFETDFFLSIPTFYGFFTSMPQKAKCLIYPYGTNLFFKVHPFSLQHCQINIHM